MENKIKLLLLSRGNYLDKKLWSGTPYTLNELLGKRKDIEYKAVNWDVNKLIGSFYFRLLNRFIYITFSLRERILRLFGSKNIYLIMSKNKGYDYALFVCDFYIPKSISSFSKYAVYTDSHVYEYQKYCIEDKRLLKNSYYKDFNKITTESLNRAKFIFTQNEWTKSGFIRDYGIPAGKIFNVGFGINLNLYKGEKNYDQNNLLIVLRKGTEYYKGLYLLLDAFKILRKKRKDIILDVVGTNVGENIEGVRCYYNYPRKVTEELFKKSTLYVMPSLHEPNGITYLEALANKTPIIGLNRFAFPEFSGYGKWGFIVEKADPIEVAEKIEYAFSDKKRLEEMGKLGQDFVEKNFQWDIVVDKMINIISNR